MSPSLFNIPPSTTLQTVREDFWRDEMAPEVVLQLVMLSLTLSMFLIIHKLLQQAEATKIKQRSKNRDKNQSNRHLIQGSQLLSRARSNATHVKNALAEADKALAFTPKDPAPYILKSMALDMMGHKSAALKSLDFALSRRCGKSLSATERGDALIKRARLKLAMSRTRRVESAIEDLVEAARLGDEMNSSLLCLLGECL